MPWSWPCPCHPRHWLWATNLDLVARFSTWLSSTIVCKFLQKTLNQFYCLINPEMRYGDRQTSVISLSFHKLPLQPVAVALKPIFLALALKPKSLALQPEAITLALALPPRFLALALLCLALALYLLALLISLSFWNVDAGIIRFREGFAHVDALDSLQCGAPTTLEYLKITRHICSHPLKCIFQKKILTSLINKQEGQLHKIIESSTIFNTSVYGYIVVGSLFLMKPVEISEWTFSGTVWLWVPSTLVW